MRMRRGNRKQIARSLAPASDRSEKVTYSSCNRLILILLAFLLGTIGVLAVLWKTKSSPSHFDPANIAATATEGNIKKIDPIEKYNLRKADIVTAAPKEPKEGHLIIKTMHGDIAIVLLPELSAESVRYVRDMVSDLRQKGKVTCDRCTFHRAEKDLLLQGVLTTDDLPKNDVFGPCPDPHFTPSSNCPPHDPECGCHGPVMTRGMVAWAAGSAGGPDFFINTFHRPVEWWDHQHTVWGEVRDEVSFAVLDKIYKLPVSKAGQLNMLKERIRFSVELK